MVNKKQTVLFNQQDYIRVPEDGIFYSELKSGDKIKKEPDFRIYYRQIWK
ncbi:hypothetical protein [Chryseobacterium indoltheticum]